MGVRKDVGVRIKTMRQSRKMTQQDLANQIGKSATAITMYETGKREPDFETLESIADAFNVPMSELITGGKYSIPDGLVPISDMKRVSIPVIGSVAAGAPILADESFDLFIDSPVKADYALRVKGNSMEPTYLDGDIVYIRITPTVPEGAVAVVLIDDDACIKHVYYIPNGVLLVSDNPAYPPKTYTWPEHDNIRVLGAVVGFTRLYK